MTRFKLLLLVPALLAATAAEAQAASVTLGPDLASAPPASIAVSDPNDWGAWNTTLASQLLVQSPVQGEVNVVRLKGRVNPSAATSRAPDVVMHAQVLRPNPDGSVTVPAGGTSRNLPLPFGGDPQQISTFTRSQIDMPDGTDGKGGSRLCIQKGDYIALATSGGYGGPMNGYPEGSYPDGAQFQMFASVAGSAANVFLSGKGQGNGDGTTFTGPRGDGAQLLLQATIGTGPDARYTCQTPEEQHGGTTPGPGTPAVGKVTIRHSGTPRIHKSRVKIAVACGSEGPCDGTLTLTNRRRKYGSAKLALAAGATAKVSIKLNKAAKRQLKKGRGKVTVKASAKTGDGTVSARFTIKR